MGLQVGATEQGASLSFHEIYRSKSTTPATQFFSSGVADVGNEASIAVLVGFVGAVSEVADGIVLGRRCSQAAPPEIPRRCLRRLARRCSRLMVTRKTKRRNRGLTEPGRSWLQKGAKPPSPGALQPKQNQPNKQTPGRVLRCTPPLKQTIARRYRSKRNTRREKGRV